MNVTDAMTSARMWAEKYAKPPPEPRRRYTEPVRMLPLCVASGDCPYHKHGGTGGRYKTPRCKYDDLCPFQAKQRGGQPVPYGRFNHITPRRPSS